MSEKIRPILAAEDEELATRIGGLLLKGIGEMRRAYERRVRVQLVREMMEHQHTPAGAVRPDSKAAAVTGKSLPPFLTRAQGEFGVA